MGLIQDESFNLRYLIVIYQKTGRWMSLVNQHLVATVSSLLCSNFGFLNYLFQRPRRVGAKFTGEDIKGDEHLQPQLSFDYDGKRDRYLFVSCLLEAVYA